MLECQKQYKTILTNITRGRATSITSGTAFFFANLVLSWQTKLSLIHLLKYDDNAIARKTPYKTHTNCGKSPVTLRLFVLN